ncbi:MAG: SurA N-terminal domain-containing protein [Candidatus Woesebacteria bacterium]|jgi:parvulin-like peptidyl-prolyl isomerase
MKKLFNKISRNHRQQPQQPGSSSLRITNETVAEHRERVLAGGRKFKYPLQYTKHRVVVVTAIIVFAIAILASAIGGWQLYSVQNASKFMLRVTQVLPVPVAEVDGAQVRYSDYLLNLRSSLHYLSTKEAVNFSSDDGKRQLDYQKRLALNKAIENAYIQKIAEQQGVNVSQDELDTYIDKEITNNPYGVTKEMYQQVVGDYYDWTFDDYKNSVREQLLRKKLAAKIDVEGRQQIQAAWDALNATADFAETAKGQSEDVASAVNGGDVGYVSMNVDDPSGLIVAAEGLEPGQFSGVIEGVDGFYIIKVYDKREKDIHFAKIFVSYKTLNQQIAQLKVDGKVKEYISVPETVQSTNQ